MTGSDRRRTAVITGATAGIGGAFARRLAADGYDVLLVARGADRLGGAAKDLGDRYGVTATALPADLSTPDGCDAVAARLGDVHLLVNNAGIGLDGAFVGSDLADEERLLALNVRAVLRLTHAALPGMVERRRGAVVNVSSVAGFATVQPGSTYGASKAWVTAFSESIGQSVRSFGVRVMALCPGYTRTEFHGRAGIDMSKTPGWMWLDADRVVEDGLRDLARGRLISVPDWKYKAAVFAMRHAPARLLQAVARDTRGRIGR